MDTAPLRTYGGVTGKDRAAERRSQLMAAGLDLLGAPGGTGELTVRGVCRRTGLTARYFYESFTDRDELAGAIYDDVVRGLAAAVVAAVDAAPRRARDQTLAGLTVLIRRITEDPRHGRLLFSRALGDTPVVAARRVESTRWFVDVFSARIRAFHGLADQDPRVDVNAELLVGGLAQVLTSWLDGTLAIEEQALVEHCTRLFIAVGRGTPATA